MCIQNWQTVNKHQGNEHVPSSFSVAEDTQLFFLPYHPSVDRILFTSSSSWCLTLCHRSLFSPAFPIIRTSTFPLYHCCFVCFSTWMRASTSFVSSRYMLAAQPSSVSELLQEPHRAQVLNIPAFSSRKSSRSPLSSHQFLSNISCKYGRLKEGYSQIQSVTSSKMTWKIVTII